MAVWSGDVGSRCDPPASIHVSDKLGHLLELVMLVLHAFDSLTVDFSAWLHVF